MGNVSSTSPIRKKSPNVRFDQGRNLIQKQSQIQSQNPVDFVTSLPEEITLLVIQKLSIDDIQTIRQVCKGWNRIGSSDQVWRHHCTVVWPTILTRPSIFPSWKQLYKSILYACSFANSDQLEHAFEHFHTYGIIPNTADGKAATLNDCTLLNKSKVGRYLSQHPQEMDMFFKLQRFERRSLPDALRLVFAKAKFPNTSSLSLAPIIKQFVQQYIDCNAQHVDDGNHIHVLCYSIILLGVDMHNPNIKSKMTKREFIKNNHRIIPWDQDYFGEIYDDVYLHGHVAEPRRDPVMSNALKALTS